MSPELISGAAHGSLMRLNGCCEVIAAGLLPIYPRIPAPYQTGDDPGIINSSVTSVVNLGNKINIT